MFDTLAYKLSVLYKNFYAYASARLHPFGLHNAWIFFILYVGKHADCTPAELTKSLHVDWGYSQRCITKLVEEGFLTKEKAGRSYHLNLTGKGQQVYQESHQLFFDWDQAAAVGTDRGGAPYAVPAAAKNIVPRRGHSPCMKPLQARNYGGIRLKNRIIFAPTTLGLKGEAYQAKLQEIARGGCAMIILGDVPVGKHGFGQSLFTAKGLRGLSAHYGDDSPGRLPGVRPAAPVGLQPEGHAEIHPRGAHQAYQHGGSAAPAQ